MTKRVLLLSYAYPPLQAPESWLSAKAVAGLRAHDVLTTVVAARPRWWHSTDETLVSFAHEAADGVLVVETPRWLPIVQPVSWLRQFPDPMRFLHRRAVCAIETIEPESFDAMITWSQWHSVHLVGLSVKRRHPSLRWLAHFSDPWVDNPLVRHHRVARARNRVYEHKVVHAADVIETTSPETLERLVARHPTMRATSGVLPHAFAPTLYSGSPPTTGPIVFRYVGAFYAGRTAEPLVRGLAALGGAVGDVRVELIGRADHAEELARRAGLPNGRVVVRDHVSYLDSLRLMREADVLLLVDGVADTNLFVASKLIDYIGAGRPVVGLTPPGMAADVIRRMGGWVADPRDVPAISDALASALAAVRRARGAPWGDGATRAEFEVDEVGRRRRELLFG